MTTIFIALVAFAGCTAHSSTATETTPVSEHSFAAHAQDEMTPPSSNADVTADDPTMTDPDNYVAIMENPHVRVLRYHDEPGTRTHQHHHPASVLYSLSAFRRRLTFPDGTVTERSFSPGDVMWVPAQTHIGENIGTTATEVLLVEMREE
jgi:hypothetical protein